MSSILKTWQRLSSIPAGKAIFSRAICFKAPYFSTIKPQFEVLDIGQAVVVMRDRRSVHNHLGGVHAIALCNLAEAAAGLTAEVSMPPGMRWIPMGMTVQYLKPAKGTLRAYSDMTGVVPGEKEKVPVNVVVKNESGEAVFRAVIDMYVSPKR